jgi:RimJ/RimL family protein N-acetyltransferase
VLTEADAQHFHALRLRSLRDHPEAFGASFEEEEVLPIETVRERLQSSSPDRFTLGAFLDDQLVGIIACSRSPRPKTRHKGHIGGMYVAPEARGGGVGRALLAETVARARSLPGLEELVLAVTAGNERARQLYIAAGFEPYCVEPRYIKLDGQYFDIEWMILRPIAD